MRRDAACAGNIRRRSRPPRDDDHHERSHFADVTASAGSDDPVPGSVRLDGRFLLASACLAAAGWCRVCWPDGRLRAAISADGQAGGTCTGGMSAAELPASAPARCPGSGHPVPARRALGRHSRPAQSAPLPGPAAVAAAARRPSVPQAVPDSPGPATCRSSPHTGAPRPSVSAKAGSSAAIPDSAASMPRPVTLTPPPAVQRTDSGRRHRWASPAAWATASAEAASAIIRAPATGSTGRRPACR